jgi:repressor of nif and glnA expression
MDKDTVLSDRQLQILRVVLEGAGDWDARWIDITVHVRYGPGELVVLRELEKLEERGLVKRSNTRPRVGGRWVVTDAGLAHIF